MVPRQGLRLAFSGAQLHDVLQDDAGSLGVAAVAGPLHAFWTDALGQGVYRVTQQFPDPGWVDLLTLMFHSFCPAAVLILPISHRPKQDGAESVTAEIKVNSPRSGFGMVTL